MRLCDFCEALGQHPIVNTTRAIPPLKNLHQISKKSTNKFLLLNSVFARLFNASGVITGDVQGIEPVPWRTGDTIMV